MASAAQTIHAARRRAGLTQAELGKRLGISQAAIARLEGPRSNPTVATLERALHATGHKLMLNARVERIPQVDEARIIQRLRMTPAERLAAFSKSHSNINRFRAVAKPIDAS